MLKEYVYQTFINAQFKIKYNMYENHNEAINNIIKTFGIKSGKFCYVDGEYLYFFRGTLLKLKTFIEETGEEWNEEQLYECVEIDTEFNRNTSLEVICHSIGNQLNNILKGKRIIENKPSVLKKYILKEKASFFRNEILSVLFSEADLNRIGFFFGEHEEFCYALPGSQMKHWMLLKLPFQIFLNLQPEEEKFHFTINGVSYVIGKEIFNYSEHDVCCHIHKDVGFKDIKQPMKSNVKVTSVLTGKDYVINEYIKAARKDLRKASGEYNYRINNGIEQMLGFYLKQIEYNEQKIQSYQELRDIELAPTEGYYEL